MFPFCVLKEYRKYNMVNIKKLIQFTYWALWANAKKNEENCKVSVRLQKHKQLQLRKE